MHGEDLPTRKPAGQGNVSAGRHRPFRPRACKPPLAASAAAASSVAVGRVSSFGTRRVYAGRGEPSAQSATKTAHPRRRSPVGQGSQASHTPREAPDSPRKPQRGVSHAAAGLHCESSGSSAATSRSSQDGVLSGARFAARDPRRALAFLDPNAAPLTVVQRTLLCERLVSLLNRFDAKLLVRDGGVEVDRLGFRKMLVDVIALVGPGLRVPPPPERCFYCLSPFGCNDPENCTWRRLRELEDDSSESCDSSYYGGCDCCGMVTCVCESC